MHAMQDKNSKIIILFDGMCNLCSAGVEFVIRRDHQAVFIFYPLQSETAQKLLEKHSINIIGADTFILIKDNECLFRSDAALEVLRHLSGIWPMFSCFKILPRSIRDSVYSFIARHRYSWFGHRQTCKHPQNKSKKRFLE